MADRVKCTKKTLAKYKPQEGCIFFHERPSAFDCGALNACYCTMEQKQCAFYKGKSPQKSHELYIPETAPAKGRGGYRPPLEITRELVEQMIREYNAGKSWTEVAADHHTTTKRIQAAREKYGLMEVTRPRKSKNRIPDEVLDWARKAKEAGIGWPEIEQYTGYSAGGIYMRLKKEGKL